MLTEKQKSLSRRNFIGTVGTAAAAFTIVPRNVLAGRGYKQPSDLLNIAGIGVGARGGSDVRGIADPDVPDVQSISRPRLPNPYTPEQLKAFLAPPAPPAPREQPAAAAAEPAEAPRHLANIYALCDVDTEKASHMFKSYPKAKVYTDWRQMLEKEPSIDGIVVGTPDHNHAIILAAFMREKKHVYCEKPLCKTIVEARPACRDNFSLKLTALIGPRTA